MPEISSVGTPIRNLQYMLRVIAKADSSIPTVAADGIYGRNTMQAVTAFQAKAGLPLTGIVDRNTWNALTEGFRRAVVFLREAEPVRPALQPNQVIQVGEKNLHLYLIQSMLKAISEVYPNVPAAEITGILDDDSAAAIRFLQQIADLPVTGAVDRQTWQFLARLYQTVVRDGTPETIEETRRPQTGDAQTPDAPSDEAG